MKKRMSSTTNHVTAKGETSYLDNTIHVNFLFDGSLHLQSDKIKFKALLCFSLESQISPKFKNVILRFLVAFFQVCHNWQKLFAHDSHYPNLLLLMVCTSYKTTCNVMSHTQLWFLGDWVNLCVSGVGCVDSGNRKGEVLRKIQCSDFRSSGFGISATWTPHTT